MAGGEEVVVAPTKMDPKVELADLKASVDQFFLVVMGMITFFMQCGFALLECGSVTSKNASSILIKNLMDCLVAAVMYFILGFPLAYGSGNEFVGYDYFIAWNLPPEQYSYWFFQFMFAATAVTIVSGALAERCTFAAYIVYSCILSGAAYPIVTHWCWSQYGFLKHFGFQDFAGSAVVHLQGGTAAFVGAYLLGPRHARFDEQGNPRLIRGHSVPLTAMGGFILIFGFLAFNGGSQMSITSPGDGNTVCRAVVNTVLCGTSSSLVALILTKFTTKNWSLLISLNAALAGMVAACAGCNVYQPWVACVIGVVAGLSYLAVTKIVFNLFMVDDPVDAVGVHFGGGLWGILAQPIFKNKTGVLFSWSLASLESLAVNLAGAAAIIVWTTIISVLMFGLLKKTNLLRVELDVEIKGLDIEEPAYPIESYGHGYNQIEPPMDFAELETVGGRPGSKTGDEKGKV